MTWSTISETHTVWPRQDIKLPNVVVKEESCEKADCVTDSSGKMQIDDSGAQQLSFICWSICPFIYFHSLCLFNLVVEIND